MSRATDVKALQKMRNEIVEINSLLKMADAELEKYESVVNELKTTKFVFDPLPTNGEQTLRADLKEKWRERFSNTRPFKSVFLALYSLAVLIFSIILIIDLAKDSQVYFHASHGHPEPVETVLTCATQAVFALAVIALPWYTLVDIWDAFEGIKVVGIVGAVSGVMFAVVCSWTESMEFLFIYLACVVGAIIVSYLIGGIFRLVAKVPIYSSKQRALLAAEKQKDKDNAEKNIEKEKTDRAAWQEWWDKYKFELDDRMDVHMNMAKAAVNKAEEHDEICKAMDILGDNERNIEVIDWLLYFINSHRADSIKEALHEYDNMLQNQKMLEIEKAKFDLEVAKAKKEDEDRRLQMEQAHRHQIEMEAQAARAAASQAQIAADTAAMRDSADRMRRDMNNRAAEAADLQQRIAGDMTFIRMNEYYNS